MYNCTKSKSLQTQQRSLVCIINRIKLEKWWVSGSFSDWNKRNDRPLRVRGKRTLLESITTIVRVLLSETQPLRTGENESIVSSNAVVECSIGRGLQKTQPKERVAPRREEYYSTIRTNVITTQHQAELTSKHRPQTNPYIVMFSIEAEYSGTSSMTVIVTTTWTTPKTPCTGKDCKD